MKQNQRDLENDVRLSNGKPPGFSRSTSLRPTIYLVVTDSISVQKLVDSKPVGSKLQLELSRQGQTLNLSIQTAALPSH